MECSGRWHSQFLYTSQNLRLSDKEAAREHLHGGGPDPTAGRFLCTHLTPVSYTHLRAHETGRNQNTYGINSGIYAVRKWEIDDSIFSAKWNCRFCKLLGQRIKARSLTSGKKHCYHLFCHNLSPCFNRCIHYNTLFALWTIFLCIFHYFLFFYRFYSVFFSSFTVLS